MTVPMVRSRDTCATLPVTGALTTMHVIDACEATAGPCQSAYPPLNGGPNISIATMRRLGYVHCICLPIWRPAARTPAT